MADDQKTADQKPEAKAAPAPKKDYTPIPTLLTEEPSPEHNAATNNALRDVINRQIGTHAGWQTDSGGNEWEVRQVGGRRVLMSPDPDDPLSMTVWNPTLNQAPHSVHLGGEQYYNEVKTLRDQVSGEGGMDPLTGKAFGKDALEMNYAELRNAQAHISKARTFNAPNQGDLEQITTAHQASDVLHNLTDDYAAMGGMGHIKQFLNKLQTTTGLSIEDWIAGKGPDTPERTAYLRFSRDLANAQAQGINVDRLTKSGAAGGVVDALTGVLGETGIFKPLIAAGATGALNLAKQIAQGDWDDDAVRALTPMAAAQLDRQIVDKVSSLADPASKTLLPESFRDYGRKAITRLQNTPVMDPKTGKITDPGGIGPDDSIPEKIPLLPKEGVTAGTTAAAGPGLGITPWEKTLSSIPAVRGLYNISYGPQGLIGGSVQALKNWFTPQGDAQQQPQAPAGQTPNPAPQMPVKSYAKGGIVRAPQLAMVGEAGPEAIVPLSGEQAQQTPNAEQSLQTEEPGGAPALYDQGQVDALKRGTTFTWVDGNSYVKS